MVYLPRFRSSPVRHFRLLWLYSLALVALLPFAPSPFAPSLFANAQDTQLALTGEIRARLERLTGQFRSLPDGDSKDQALFFRTLVKADGRRSRLLWRVELQDSRAYLDDRNSPISTSFVNPLDILEANIGIATDSRGSEIRIGRFTQDVGSRRVFARNGFRNTINAFSGINGHFLHPDGSQTRVILAVPVARRPVDRGDLGANRIAFDRERFRQRIWGLWHQRALGLLGADIELYSFGLFEEDGHSFASRNRRIISPGVRILRRAERGAFDFDIETTVNLGRARASTDASDMVDLDVSAHFHHLELGYTWDTDWSWRLSLEYDFASGDGDPHNATLGRYDSLFGVRRREFGNTSLFGPIDRANLDQPSLRLSFKKGRWDGRVHALYAWLEQAEDQFRVPGLSDPSGASGDDIGLLLSGRTRYWAIPDRLRLEAGFGVLAKGRLTRTAPGANPSGDTLYGYVQITTRF